jgi:hypothetical protein
MFGFGSGLMVTSAVEWNGEPNGNVHPPDDEGKVTSISK